MNIRQASPDDLKEILSVYEAARKFMTANGNPHQWGDDKYPDKALLVEDIQKGQLYVLDYDGSIDGVFMSAPGPDAIYGRINGRWLNEQPYYVIHRIASAGRKRGILALSVQFVLKLAKNIRIDTHCDNRIMQAALSRSGFVKCGIIHLENGEERIAYQLSL